MNARRVLIVVLVAILAAALLAAAAIVWARAYSYGASDFKSNGAQISGWHWLRSSGNTATWTFEPTALQGASSAYINFNPLCTNGVNGGSGYDCSVKLMVMGARKHTTMVNLVNPYRPIDPGNSGGVGYQCYGHSSAIPASVLKGATKITVTVSFPFPSGRHVAVNRGCMSIGCSK